MFKCHVCGSSESHTDMVSEVFNLDGRMVLVENIPATICARCGDATFSRETTERIRQMVHQSQPSKTVRMDVFAFA